MQRIKKSLEIVIKRSRCCWNYYGFGRERLVFFSSNPLFFNDYYFANKDVCPLQLVFNNRLIKSRIIRFVGGSIRIKFSYGWRFYFSTFEESLYNRNIRRGFVSSTTFKLSFTSNDNHFSRSLIPLPHSFFSPLTKSYVDNQTDARQF